jgi:predicted molibdopterin-dependent oxidoreductase YjgC
MLGFAKTDTPLDGMREGDVLIIADHDLLESEVPLLQRAAAVIVISTVMPTGLASADVVLPIANFSEEEGTFTNVRGRVQRYLQAKAAPGLARPSWYVLTDLLAALGESAGYFLPSEVFAALAASHGAFAGQSYDSLGLRGQPAATEVGA